MEGKLLRVVQGLYWVSEAALRVGNDVMDWFEVEKGVGLGCPISPWLFDTNSHVH